MFPDHDAVAAALPARLHRAVGGPTALALLADLLLLDGEVVLVPVVEIAQGHRHADFHVRAAALAGGAAPEVAAAAEEAGEEVERVVLLAATAAGGLLAMLGEAFMAILVVDTAGGGVGEGVVGVGYGDEFLFGGVVASGKGGKGG